MAFTSICRQYLVTYVFILIYLYIWAVESGVIGKATIAIYGKFILDFNTCLWESPATKSLFIPSLGIPSIISSGADPLFDFIIPPVGALGIILRCSAPSPSRGVVGPGGLVPGDVILGAL